MSCGEVNNAMSLRLLPTLLIASVLLTACQGPTAPPTRPPFTVSAKAAATEARVLVEGTFTLPASLVSVGSGNLVSVGSGNLVSVGSGNYRLQSVPGDVGVAGATVALLPSRGLDLGVSTAKATTDAQGHYRLTGVATAGIYVVDATQNGHHYRSLAAVHDGDVAQAAIDVATTMVTSRLLTEKQGAGLDVLPTQLFAETVATVRAAIAAHGLPEGFTPDQANVALGLLEQKDPAVARAIGDLEAEQTRLETRYSQLSYQVQNLAAQLGLPPATVAAEMRAVLSENPQASDEEVTRQVKTTRTSSGGTATPSSPAAPASAAPTPPPSVQPSAPVTTAPVASTAPKPAENGQGNGVSKDPAPSPTAKPGNGNANGHNNGNHGNGNGQSATPSPVATATPTPVPSSTPSTATPSATPSPTPTPQPTASGDGTTSNPGNQGNGQGSGNTNGNGNGNANGHDNGNNGNANGNSGNNGQGNGQSETGAAHSNQDKTKH